LNNVWACDAVSGTRNTVAESQEALWGS